MTDTLYLEEKIETTRLKINNPTKIKRVNVLKDLLSTSLERLISQNHR